MGLAAHIYRAYLFVLNVSLEMTEALEENLEWLDEMACPCTSTLELNSRCAFDIMPLEKWARELKRWIWRFLSEIESEVSLSKEGLMPKRNNAALTLGFCQSVPQLRQGKGFVEQVDGIALFFGFDFFVEKFQSAAHVYGLDAGIVRPDVVHQRESVFQRHFDVRDNEVRFELEVLDITVLPVFSGLDPMRAVL
jgi:hypothetical protein